MFRNTHILFAPFSYEVNKNAWKHEGVLKTLEQHMEKQWKMPVFEKGEKKQRVFFHKTSLCVYRCRSSSIVYNLCSYIYICTYIMKSQI